MSNEIAEVFSPEEASESPEVTETPEETTAEQTAEKPESEPASEQEEKPEAEEKPEDTPEDTDEGKEPELSAEQNALLKQAKDERRKRQERDERIRELEAKLAEQEQGVERPDVFEDQEGFVESLRSEYKEELGRQRLDIQRSMMIEFKDDYEEVEAAVLEEMRDNPVLKAELQKAPNVAKAVYEYGKKMAQFNEAKGFNKEEYEAKLRAEIKAELEKEYKEKLASEDTGETLSPSLANARGSKNSDEKGVETISDVFA